jgi:hypothetical protein
MPNAAAASPTINAADNPLRTIEGLLSMSTGVHPWLNGVFQVN